MKYRPHRGLLYESMDEVVEITDFTDLVRHLRETTLYIPEQTPTTENVEVKPYVFDSRIGWDTHIVTVDDHAWGFTDGPCERGCNP